MPVFSAPLVTEMSDSIHRSLTGGGGGGGRVGGFGTRPSVSGCLPLVVPIGLSPLLILTVGTCFGCVNGAPG